jgi:hypothetical protein
MKVPVSIDYRDGRYRMHRTDKGGYREGWPVDAEISIDTWIRYERHINEDMTWQEIIAVEDTNNRQHPDFKE